MAEPVAAVPAAASAGALKWGFEMPTLENFDTWSENAENWKLWEAFMEKDVVRFDVHAVCMW